MSGISLDVEAVSRLARSEKSARQGHISTLGFWFARRPTGLCRALIVAVGTKHDRLSRNAKVAATLMGRYPSAQTLDEALTLLSADLAAWDGYRNEELMELARSILKVSGTRSLADPFGGGGSIPLEASRLGLEVGTGDLNPAAAILLRTMLKTLPAASPAVLDVFRDVVQRAVEWARLQSLAWYPAYAEESVGAVLWAWNIDCPYCGDAFPLISNPLLSDAQDIGVRLVPSGGRWRSVLGKADEGMATVAKGTATCPGCQSRIASSALMELRKSGRMTEMPYALATNRPGGGRTYCADVKIEVDARPDTAKGAPEALGLSLDPNGVRHLWAMAYGVESVSDVFSSRQTDQLLGVMTYLRDSSAEAARDLGDEDRAALEVLVALLAVRLSLYNSRHSWWQGKGDFPAQTFVRQALSMVWNYCEIPPSSEQAGGILSAGHWIETAARPLIGRGALAPTTIWCGPADQQPLPDGSVDLVVTDPPYFDSITYAYLSDVFYPVYRYMLRESLAWSEMVAPTSSPREREAIVDRPHASVVSPKDADHFREVMSASFMECRRVLRRNGQMVVMYGHKKEAAWETLLEAIARAGFSVVDAVELASERGAKFQHGKVDHLEDSVALICRPSPARRSSPAATLENIKELVADSRLR